MSKNTLFVALGVLLVLIAVGVSVVVVMRMQKTSTLEPANPFGNSVLPGDSHTKPAITVSTTAGEQVSVPDFRTGHEPDHTPAGTIYTIRAPEYSNTEMTFSLQYNEATSEFLVVLLQEPIGAARKEAEQYLKAMLMLQDTELCALNTTVVVMPSVNPAFATYENLGLSFCPGAVPLP